MFIPAMSRRTSPLRRRSYKRFTVMDFRSFNFLRSPPFPALRSSVPFVFLARPQVHQRLFLSNPSLPPLAWIGRPLAGRSLGVRPNVAALFCRPARILVHLLSDIRLPKFVCSTLKLFIMTVGEFPPTEIGAIPWIEILIHLILLDKNRTNSANLSV